jgi:hypothetical protein
MLHARVRRAHHQAALAGAQALIAAPLQPVEVPRPADLQRQQRQQARRAAPRGDRGAAQQQQQLPGRGHQQQQQQQQQQQPWQQRHGQPRHGHHPPQQQALRAALSALADPSRPVALPPAELLLSCPANNWELDKLFSTLGRSKATWRRALMLFEWLKEAGHEMDDRLCTTVGRRLPASGVPVVAHVEGVPPSAALMQLAPANMHVCLPLRS